MKDWKKFIVAALVRSLRTFCQTFIGFIAVGAALSDIPWLEALSVSAVAALLSIMTSIITGLPEVDKVNSEKGAHEE